MATTDYVSLPQTKTVLDGTEYGALQEAGGGTDSSFNYQMSALADYITRYKTGYFHYNDLATTASPFTHSGAGGFLPLPCDGLGARTSDVFKPIGVSDLWNTTTNQFDFSSLSNGDRVDIHIDLTATTSSNNQEVLLKSVMAIGGDSYSLNAAHVIIKSSGVFNVLKEVSFSIDDDNTRLNPAEIQIDSDSSISVVVNGLFIRVVRR